MASSPSTPAPRYPLQNTYRPLNSSPLASPSPPRFSAFASSSTVPKSLPERRRLQFKSQTPTSLIARSSTLPSPSSPSPSRHTLSSRTRSIPSSGSASAGTFITSRQAARPQFEHPEDPQKQFFRERIRAKCLERVQKARARTVKQRRYTGHSDRSSDGFDVDDEDGFGGMDDDDDEEEDDDAIMVGSSFDPDLEDVGEWEEMQEKPASCPDFSPADLEEEEVEAYAEEYFRQAALDDFADIPEEELFHLSDIDEILDEPPADKDHDKMDLS
ncbi:hypothetical protein AN958_02186 [Leucoagaricus sp. SymC.cos]|nr:hypothetical protein AN958_02186 [Leucoagaricus sp. SymC.cos]